MKRTHHSGFAIVAAIFILVVLGALAGFVVSITTTQNLSLAMDYQGARALQAARAGTEWGIARWLNTDSCTGSSVITPTTCSPGGGAATCTETTLAPSASLTGLTEFTIVVALCACPAPPTSGTCQITATASSGMVGSPNYIERRLSTIVEGAAP
jgi:MSHA biogenesis protein MshP